MAEAPPASAAFSLPGDIPATGALRSLLVVRHGETEWNSRKVIQGTRDVPLSAEGLAQAEALAKRLTGAKIDAVYSSPQLRASRTAEILSAALGLQPLYREAFREIDCGEFEGKTYPEIRAEMPDTYGRWMDDPELPAPGGESFHGFVRRVGAGLREILDGPYATVLLSGHSGTSRAVISSLFGFDYRLAIRLDQRNTSLSIFRWEEGKCRMKLWNGTRHLDDVV